ncbi:MAG: AAA family ATPase, partial [Blastocatellia bacterium]|nr:AAA family ATPase [Blastocatellia bacterium]
MSTTLNLAPVKPHLDKLQALERELIVHMIERDEVIRASLVALLSRQHLVVLGPPGTGKSALVTSLAERVSSPNGAGLRNFSYLMTRFTTPEELFGPVSVSGLKHDEYRRITSGKLVEAELVFLDEIFKAGSAILNALLKIANERVFHNGGQEMQLPLISLFGASNEMPQGNELEALWDRFLLRFRVGYVTDTGFARFIRAASAKLGAKLGANQNGHNSNGGHPQALLQSELVALQQSAAQVAVPNGVVDLIEQLRRDLAAKGIIVSDRRWGQSLGLLQAHALTEGRDVVTEDDLIFLKHVLWQSPEQQAEIGKALARIGNPLNSKAVDYEDQAASAHRECMDAQQAAQSEEQKMQSAIEANTKLKQVGVKLQELREQAVEQGRNTNRIDKVIEAVTKMKQEIASLVL